MSVGFSSALKRNWKGLDKKELDFGIGIDKKELELELLFFIPKELELELNVKELELELNWKKGIDPSPGSYQLHVGITDLHPLQDTGTYQRPSQQARDPRSN